MGTQILRGSVGEYKPFYPETFGETKFIVTADTCMESEKILVQFIDIPGESYILLTRVEGWDKKLTEDY